MADEIKELLKDILVLNSIIAAEALQITENTSKIARKSMEVPEQCQISHNKLRNQIINILKKHVKDQAQILDEHIITH
ncbi:MAG: hypothetical protein HWN67_01395 [Candidatus Helarchaeota archaeon]|nr:hypothetical protein [Candidatus Helarchaeota archaeon]